ncbi:MAG: hypothetical protein HDKAJFGB_00908 [Anaerolineae bacterium]|nr:hypothetical protein [Anaerolineae bacterium]
MIAAVIVDAEPCFAPKRMRRAALHRIERGEPFVLAQHAAHARHSARVKNARRRVRPFFAKARNVGLLAFPFARIARLVENLHIGGDAQIVQRFYAVFPINKGFVNFAHEAA